MIDEKSFFVEGTLKICSHLEIENAMAACLETLIQVMPADGMYMQFYDKDFDAMRIAASATQEGGKKIDGLVPLTPEGREMIDLWSSMFHDGQQPEILILNRPETEPVSRAMLEFHGVGGQNSSLMIMILGLTDSPLGSIALHAHGHDQFSEEHARLLSLLRDPFTIAVSNARKHLEVIRLKDLLADDNHYLQKEIQRISGDKIIGSEYGLKPVMEMVTYVAEHDSPVLILGETGVGKDIIANAIHNSSSRNHGPFITVNCGAIPPTLLDSELFGHEKGSFTGALSQKRGRFERADKGTIFLDEVGELTPEAQVRLLRVLQNREVERVGGIKNIPVDIRVIAATNRDLEQMIRKGRFREDLWFRLNVFPITIPPLRARKSDIPALVDYFVKKKARDLKFKRIPGLVPGSMNQLQEYYWPGNVRELENVVERALIMNKSGSVSFDILRNGDSFQPENSPVQKETELPLFGPYVKEYLTEVLKKCKGRINGPGGAADLADLNPSTLRNKLKKYRVPFGTRG
jgi:transcriptional regulator with GAF, ATPase, and Fis domain